MEITDDPVNGAVIAKPKRSSVKGSATFVNGVISYKTVTADKGVLVSFQYTLKRKTDATKKGKDGNVNITLDP